VIGSYVESFLNENETMDKLFDAIKKDCGPNKKEQLFVPGLNPKK
jgi:hypothetical protein